MTIKTSGTTPLYKRQIAKSVSKYPAISAMFDNEGWYITDKAQAEQ